MKNIEVLGTEKCVKCTNLTNKIADMILVNNFDAHVEKITDLARIMGYGVMSVPSVVVDGKLKCIGRVPLDSEITEWLK